jgi:hypothetical protein
MAISIQLDGRGTCLQHWAVLTHIRHCVHVLNEESVFLHIWASVLLSVFLSVRPVPAPQHSCAHVGCFGVQQLWQRLQCSARQLRPYCCT